MNKTFLDRVFKVEGNDAMRDLYDDWAKTYDSEVRETGYATPARVSEALLGQLAAPDLPVLDFGCGTGLSGEALRAAGLTTVDGTDLSAEMLKLAEAKGVYRRTWIADPDSPIPVRPGEYAAVTAIGVISYGAAPLSVFDDLMGILAPGGLFAFSFNDQSIADGRYEAKVDEAVETGAARILFSEYGPHLTKYGENSGSKVFVLERL